MSLACAIRYYGQHAHDLQQLRHAVIGASTYTNHVFIALNITLDTINSIDIIQSWNISNLTIIQITNDIGVSTTLNKLLLNAAQLNYDYILYQSTEISINVSHIYTLQSYFDSLTLCVGVVLDGHTFISGINILSGTTVPWNTCCIYHISSLLRTGFLTCTDGVSGCMYGVEELPCITLLQLLSKQCNANTLSTDNQRHIAKLVRLDNIQWNTQYIDQHDRLSKHHAKIQSKYTRGQTTLQLLGITSGTVLHIDHNDNAPYKQ